MKIKLKHLAGYLPYELKMEFLGFPLGKHYRTLELDCGHDFHFYLEQNKVRPILRPLSDLTKEIEVNGEKFVPIERVRNDYSGFFFETNPELLIKSKNTNMYISLNWTIEFQQKLYEWHFDIHGLIEKELAIDINTLEP